MNSQRGLTLIEVLAAMLILGIAVISFVSVSNYTTLSNYNTDNTVKALTIAEDQINTSRSSLKSNIVPIASQQVSDIYTVTQQLNPLGTAPVFSTAPKHVSLQSVVPIVLSNSSAPVPYVLTVTVEWQ